MVSELGVGIALLGFGVGVLVGMTGTGGAALTTPLLIVWFGIRPVVAVGTGLVFLTALKTVGAWVHHKSGNVDWPLVRLLATGSVPGALVGIGLLLVLRHASEGAADGVITPLLGIVLIVAFIAMIAKAILGQRRLPGPFGVGARPLQETSPGVTIALGFVVGVLVSLTSVGGGTLIVAVLFLFYDVSGRRIVGTDIAHALILSAVASTGHLGAGTVNFPMAGNLLIGAVPGLLVGSRIAVRLPERGLRAVLASVLLAAGLRLI